MRKIGGVFEKGCLTDTVMFSQAGAITDASLSFSKPAVTLLKSRSQIFTPISTNLRYCIDDLEASVTYYDNDGLPNDPVTVLPRAEEGEEGGEGEGGDEPQAQPVEPWISNVSATYKGITFEVTDNDSGFARIADLTLFIEDAKGEITKSVLTVPQGIALPALKLDSNAETYEGYAQDCAVPASTNILVPYSDQIGYDVAYDVPVAEGAEWILKPAITDDGLTFSLAKNEGSEPRTATIRLNFTDEHGNSVSASCKIIQKPYPTAADFAAVRALTPGEITLQQYIEGYTSDMDRLKENTHPNKDGFSPMEVEGTVYTDKKAAGSAILAACKAMTSPEPVPLGQYRGFSMDLSFASLTREFKVTLKGALYYTTNLGTDVFGIMLRLDNLLESMEERISTCREQLENTRMQLENAKLEVDKPFPQEDELKRKSARLDELNILLNMDKRESEIVDGDVGDEVTAPARGSPDRER